MINLPSTYEEFVRLFVSTLRKGFKRVDIVVDTYRTNLIKGEEIISRVSSHRVITESSKSSLPHDSFKFFKNGENKTRVTEIESEVLRNNFSKVLAKWRCSIVYISQEDANYCITETGVTINEEL